jgi:hypothetical protein
MPEPFDHVSPNSDEFVNRQPKTFEELLKTYRHWLFLTKDDEEVLAVILATALDQDLPGDPIWIYVIGVPASKKTELVRALSEYPRIYTIDYLTPNTFISGKVAKNKETGEFFPIAGILRDLNGRVLVIKDFTVILSLSDVARTEIYGQLRAIYDGYLERAVGTLKKPIRVEARLGIIAAVTPVIDHYTKAHSLLGERFLKARIKSDQTDESTQKSSDNLGHEMKMRMDLAKATAYYLNLVSKNPKNQQLTREQNDTLILLAKYVSVMRARVFGRYEHGRLVDLEPSEPEVPTRVVKNLKKVALGLAVVRQHENVTDEDVKTVKRVARDCAIPLRQRLVENLARPTVTFIGTSNATPASAISDQTNLPLNTVENELAKMVILNIVQIETVGEENDSITLYSLTESFRKLYESAKKDEEVN